MNDLGAPETTFDYRTSGEALHIPHPVYVSHIPDDLTWGMTPLGWRYRGHANLILGEPVDLWTPPQHAEPTTANYLAGTATPSYQLLVPRARRLGQYEIRFDYLPPAASTQTARPAPTTVWRATITTSADLNTQLLTLHQIAADPDTLAAYTALHLRSI